MKKEILYTNKHYLKKITKHHRKDIKIIKISKNKSIIDYPLTLSKHIDEKLAKYKNKILFSDVFQDQNENENIIDEDDINYKIDTIEKCLNPRIKFEGTVIPKATKTLMIPTTISTYFGKYYKFPQQQMNSNGNPTICIISLGGTFLTSDLQTYWNACGLSNPCNNINIVNVDGTTNKANQPINSNNINESMENTLDLEIAMTLCPSANIIIYFGKNSNQGFYNAINKAYTDLQKLNNSGSKIISISWGANELAFDVVWALKFNDLFKSIQSNGISVCAASGDNSCDDGSGVLSVDFPSSSPYVIACGGTTLNGALETAWSYNPRNNWGGGGGCSLYFPKPQYQVNFKINYPSILANSSLINNRTTPDIALNADPLRGWSIFFNDSYTTVGGTSCVSPAFSAFLGLCNKTYSNTVNVLSKLYTATPNCFNDIIIGTNDSLPNDGSNVYVAGIGFDQCTGLGSIKGTNLINCL